MSGLGQSLSISNSSHGSGTQWDSTFSQTDIVMAALEQTLSSSYHGSDTERNTSHPQTEFPASGSNHGSDTDCNISYPQNHQPSSESSHGSGTECNTSYPQIPLPSSESNHGSDTKCNTSYPETHLPASEFNHGRDTECNTSYSQNHLHSSEFNLGSGTECNTSYSQIHLPASGPSHGGGTQCNTGYPQTYSPASGSSHVSDTECNTSYRQIHLPASGSSHGSGTQSNTSYPHKDVMIGGQQCTSTSGSSGMQWHQVTPTSYSQNLQWAAAPNAPQMMNPYYNWSNQLGLNRPAMQPTLSASRVSSSVKKPKRIRTAFTTDQLMHLEREYAKSRYLDRPRRIALANALQLQEKTLKVWYQNRRMKEKKDNAEMVSTSNMQVPTYSQVQYPEVLNGIEPLQVPNQMPALFPPALKLTGVPTTANLQVGEGPGSLPSEPSSSTSATSSGVKSWGLNLSLLTDLHLDEEFKSI